MVEYFEELKKDGPANVAPKKPTNNVPIPYKSTQKMLRCKNLHNYLQSKLRYPTTRFLQEPKFREEKNFENMKNYLKKCVTYELLADRHNLRFHIRLGQILEDFYCLWKNEKQSRREIQSWQVWL